jgi:hypothetical protein
MKNATQTDDYEVGYGRPPKSGQFKAGVSGNPLGRPKKASDFRSKLLRELNSSLIINDNGRRRVIKKHEGIVKQLVNKALAGHSPSMRLVVTLQEAFDRDAEEQRNSPPKTDPSVKDLSDEELLMLIRAGIKEAPVDESDGRKLSHDRVTEE